MRVMLISAVAVVVTGCALFGPKSPPVTLRFHEQVPAELPESRVRLVEVPGTRQQVAVDPFPQLSEKDVAEARLEPTPGGPAVRLRFDMHGAIKLNEMTTRLRGHYVVVFVNDKPVAAVLIENVVTNGQFLLEGKMTDDEERRLVDGLNRLAGRPSGIGDSHSTP